MSDSSGDVPVLNMAEERGRAGETHFGFRDSRGLVSYGLSDPNLREFLPPGFPTLVILCGSTRFKEAYERANKEETLKGHIVLSVGILGHREGLDMDGPVKQMLDRLHLRKIDLADEVLILNVGGYVGESTRREVEYATARGKKIRYLEG